MSSNPFAALLNASEAIAQETITPEVINNEQSQENNQNISRKLINEAIEDIFGFTICYNREIPFRKTIPFVYLEEFAEDKDHYLTIELLGPALFDRLMLDDPKEYVLPKNGAIELTFVETEVLTYLFNCYERLKVYTNIDGVIENMKSMIFQNAVLFLQQPIVFPEQDAKDQCIKLIKDFERPCENFFEEISIFYNIEGQ